MVADQRHGIATALTANLNRGKDAEPFTVEDFIPWGDKLESQEEEPALLDDPVAQSNLIRAVIFGIAPKKLPDMP